MENLKINDRLDFSFLETSQYDDELYNEDKGNEPAFPILIGEESGDSSGNSRNFSEESCSLETSKTDSRNSSIESNFKVSLTMHPILRLIKAMDVILFLQNEIGRENIETGVKLLDILNVSLITQRVASGTDTLAESKSVSPFQESFDEFFSEDSNLVPQSLLNHTVSSEDKAHVITNLKAVLEHYKSLVKPIILAHPDEFKNPSSFLKVYGDPLCKGKEKRNQNCKSFRGNCPKTGVQGNWKCINCLNVNFPRRFNCLKCSAKRSQNDDEMVKSYAIEVYKELLPSFFNNSQPSGARIWKVNKIN